LNFKFTKGNGREYQPRKEEGKIKGRSRGNKKTVRKKNVSL